MLSLLVSLAFADAQDFLVKPTAAVVFADRARVTRHAGATVGTGRQEIVFTGLPASMYTDGVTADVKGSAVLRGIDLVHVTATEAADLRVKEIEAQLMKLRRERQTAVDDATARQVELSAIEASRSQSATQLSAQMLVGTKAPTQAATLRTTLSAEDAAARAAWREADGRTRDLDDKIGALERERGNLGSSATDTWKAVVHLDVDKAGRVEIDLDYLVSGASWVPRYDVRGDADAGKVAVSLSALIEQQSGEDWKDVKLTVSSARPGLGTIVPILDPFWLARPQPVYYGYAEDSAPMSRAMAAPKAASAGPMPSAPPAPPPPPMEVAQAQVDTQLAATTFVVSRPEDVPSDGTSRKVLLTTETMDAKLRHITAPRVDPRAYLVGEVTNTAEFPLLAGTAGVFLASAYIGDTGLATIAPGEKFDVAFGVDDQVTVKRMPKSIKEGASGIVGKRGTSRWDWQVRVKNGHRSAINVIVKEQIPVSTRDDVKVSARPSTPVPTSKDGGLLDFALTVGAGAEGVVTFGYEVEYPTEIQLGWME